MTWDYVMGIITGVLIAVALLVFSVPARSQEGNTATLARVYDAEQTWRRAAILVPGPAWGPAVREAVPEAPRPRQDAVQRLVDESANCVVTWHSQRKGRHSRIECW